MTDAARARRIKALWSEKRTEAWGFLRRNGRFEAMLPLKGKTHANFRLTNEPVRLDATFERITFRLEYEDPPGESWRVMADDVPLEHGHRSQLR